MMYARLPEAGAASLFEPSILRALTAEPPVGGHPVRVLRSRLGEDAMAVRAAARARAELGT
ncbi:hypothetical protein [Streptomyces canus]|uniref:hypothetical protein n=1 Tax=Streptomyces canus TaxID=58343 RepID=UPI00216B4332|nr:hypothetical protein [Streptomyces canus]